MYLVILGNLWIWKAFSSNLLIFFVCVVSSALLIKSLTQKKYYLPALLSLCLLLFTQILTTEPMRLTDLSNDQIRVRDTRLNEYPPVNIPIAYWMEAKPITVALTRIRYNFLEQLDPNLYFFANHPRERVGVNEFERFPYIILPFFLVGVSVALRKHRYLLVLSLIAVSITSVFGMSNILGNISLFPLLVVFIYIGIVKILIKYEK